MQRRFVFVFAAFNSVSTLSAVCGYGEVLLIELRKLVHRLYWVARRKDEVEDIKFIFGISINDTAHPSRNVMAE